MSKAAITLYSNTTPNGVCVSSFLEALRAKYPDNPDLNSYEAIKMSIRDADIGKVHNQVKSPWYLEINPNGRIPAITVNGFNVFETSAIILYLAELYDTKRIFSYDPVKQLKEYNEMLQWTFFAHGGIGPMQGQAGHFTFASEQIEYAKNRYLNETRRLFSVLETHLKAGNKQFIMGDKLTLADFKAWGWVRRGPMLKIELETEFPALKAWVDRIDAVPGVQKGLETPA